MTTKVSLFMANYGRNLRIEIDVWRKEKIENIMEFMKRKKRVQEEVETVLKKAQEEMKW